MNNEIFQNVFDELQDVLPDEWNSVIFFAGYTDDSYSMKYYIKDKNGVYDCFNQFGADRAQLINMFVNIDKLLSFERENLEEAQRWTVFTMIVDNQGNMKTYYDYTDISENFIDYEKEWEKKYL